MVALVFNSQQHEPSYGGIDSLPPSDQPYLVGIKSTEGKPTTTGGSMLVIECCVLEGPLAGRSQFDRLNLFNANDKTVDIANKQLSAYCHVTGVYNIQDTDQLCMQNGGKPFQIFVRQQTKNPEYTEIYKLAMSDGSPIGGAAKGPAPAPVAPPVAPQAPAVAPVAAAPGPQAWGAPAAGAAQPTAPGGWGNK
jgi:hypothetical protein